MILDDIRAELSTKLEGMNKDTNELEAHIMRLESDLNVIGNSKTVDDLKRKKELHSELEIVKEALSHAVMLRDATKNELSQRMQHRFNLSREENIDYFEIEYASDIAELEQLGRDFISRVSKIDSLEKDNDTKFQSEVKKICWEFGVSAPPMFIGRSKAISRLFDIPDVGKLIKYLIDPPKRNAFGKGYFHGGESWQLERRG